jgi:hypothetical protein
MVGPGSAKLAKILLRGFFIVYLFNYETNSKTKTFTEPARDNAKHSYIFKPGETLA